MTETTQDIESMMAVKPHTVSVTNSEGLTIRLTQDYRERFETGHYRYSITDSVGDIISVGQSIGGAPKGKLGIPDAIHLLDEYIRQLAF